jgi:reactive intermediate/imine deaminase
MAVSAVVPVLAAASIVPPATGAALPFPEGVEAGGLIFISAHIGTRPGTRELVPGGVGPEARQALQKIQSILEPRGSSRERVVKRTVFLADLADWERFNEVYRTFFPGRLPARSALAAGGLALGARVEVDCIAESGFLAAKLHKSIARWEMEE